jgi:hypothetical protein
MLTFKVTLRVFSADYTLMDLTRILGEPTKGFSVGDTYSRGKNKREQSLWALESTSLPTESFEVHLKEIINFLDGKVEEVAGLVARCKLDLFCMLSSDNGQGGALLSSLTMEKISRYNLDMQFDVYASAEED